MMDVMEIGHKRYRATAARAEMSSMVKLHGNLGKRKRMKLDNLVIVKPSGTWRELSNTARLK